MEDFLLDCFEGIEYRVPVQTTHLQTNRRKNKLVAMVQRACVCMPLRGIARARLLWAKAFPVTVGWWEKLRFVEIHED